MDVELIAASGARERCGGLFRAREAGIPFQAAHLHWSLADPAAGEQEDFETACRDIAGRIDRLARRATA